MTAVLHGSARTTPRVRAEPQAAQASSRTLAFQYGFNPKTVLKWRKCSTTVDAAMGPRACSTVLTEAEEAIVVEFICAAWKTDPTLFKVNPHHLIPKPSKSEIELQRRNNHKALKSHF